MSVLEHTTDFESITDLEQVDDKAVAADKSFVGEICSVLSLERILGAQSASRRWNKLTPSVVNARNAMAR